MRRFPVCSLAGLVLVFYFSAMASAVSADGPPEPPGGWQYCSPACWAHGYWTGFGNAVTENDYSRCSGRDAAAKSVAGYLSKSSFSTDITKVTMYMTNGYMERNWKHVHIRIEGTGATGAPFGPLITGSNDRLPLSSVTIIGPPTLTYTSGSWVVDIYGLIDPQPETVHFVVYVPGAEAAVGVSYAWIDDCCTIRIVSEPTLSEWGMIIFSLLILSLLTVVVVRRQASVAMAGGTASMSMRAPLFAPAVFWKTLAATETIAVIGLAIAISVSGILALRDIIGTLLSAAIVAYMTHLWIGTRK